MGGIARRVGLLGGTFDPPHLGHLWLAETAQEQLGLTEVVFLPVGEPPHKHGRSVTHASHRLHMLELTLQDTLFAINLLDAHRPPPHTTVTLLPLLKAMQPDAAFCWLIGADSLRDLPTWHEPQAIITQCRLGVLPRPGVEIDWEELETAVPGINAAVDWLSGPTLSLSSTVLRQWIRAGHSVERFVGTAVACYIQQHTLYTHG